MSEKVFIVWGPTAEWGDGSGPLAFFPAREQAEEYVKGEEATVEDMKAEGNGELSWPYNMVEYSIREEERESYLREVEVPEDVQAGGEEAIFEWLNE